MPLDPSCMIEVVEGKFQPGGRAQLTAIVENFRQSNLECLVIHFHGGLVPADVAIQEAASLNTAYAGSSCTLFPIWETGLFEVLINDWQKIAADGLFQILIDRVAGEVHQKASVQPVRTLQKLTQSQLLQSARGSGEIAGVDTTTWSNTATPYSQVERKAVQHRLQTDAELTTGITHSIAVHHAVGNGSLLSKIEQGVALAGGFLEDLWARSQGMDAIPTQFALGIIDTIERVLKRFVDGTDHGLHATVVEEVLRSFYGDILGYEIWNQMKSYTQEAFGANGQVYFGTGLIDELLTFNGTAKRLLLVGHSAGSIYVNEILQHAEARGVQMRIDTAFLAAALRDDDFVGTIPVLQNRNFRSFAMSDELEQGDLLLNGLAGGMFDWFYPMSLLYFITGVLERKGTDGTGGDYVDAPLVGMQRFFNRGVTAPDPGTMNTNTFLNGGANRAVWSVAVNAAGTLQANAKDHGEFNALNISYGYPAPVANTTIPGLVELARTGTF